MQIVCDQCGKKYKTREKKTKPFKIRCTQCPNVFIVDPSKMQDDEATRQVSKEMAESLLTGGKAPAQAEPAVWYAVVQDQQAGPFTVAQLTEMWASGQVTPQSYVWKDGMGGWELITSVPELAHIPTQGGGQSTASQDQQREAQQREAQQREAQQREAQELQMRAQVEVQHSPSLVVNKMTSPKPEANLLASSSSPELEHREPSAVLTTAQLKNQRNDNSVLFSLDSIEGLTASAEPSAPQPRPATVSNTGGTEGSGLIDISALGSSFGGATGAPDASGKATINLTSGMKKPPMMSKQKSNLPLILASVLLTTLGSLAGFYFFVFQPQQQAQLEAQEAVRRATQEAQRLQALAVANTTPSTPGTVEATPTSPQAVTQAVVKADAVAPPAEEPKASPEKTAKPKPRKARSSSRSRRASRSRRSARRAPKPKPKPKPTAKKSGEASSLLSGLHGKKKDLPAKPSRGAITGAMKRVNVKRCASYDPSLKGKKVFVQVKIVSSGKVQSATSLPPVRGTTTGSCLEREVRKQKVPPFKERDVSFKFPFMLR